MFRTRTAPAALLTLLLLMASGGRVWAISGEFHGLMADIVAQMDVAAAEMPARDACTASMWSRSKSLIRNELSTPLPDLFEAGNPEVIDETYGLFRCKDRLQATWQKPTPENSKSHIDITLDINCTCNPGKPTDIKQGQLRFRVPVSSRQDFLRKTRYTARKPTRYEMDLACCGSDRQGYRAYSGDGKRVAVRAPISAQEQTARRQAQQAAVAKQRAQQAQQRQQRERDAEEARRDQESKAEQAQRQQKARAEAVERAREYQIRVCKECEELQRTINAHKAEQAAKRQEIARHERDLQNNRDQAADVERKIRKIKRKLAGLSTGGSASSTDPFTGERIESVQNPDGSFTITTYNSRGQQIDQYKRDPKRKKQQRDKFNKQLQDAEAEAARLKKQRGELSVSIQRARNWIRHLDGEIAHLYHRLRDCLERCRKSAAALPPHLAQPVPDYSIPSQVELDHMSGSRRRPPPTRSAEAPDKVGSQSAAPPPTGGQPGSLGTPSGQCDGERLTRPVLVGETKEFKGVGKTIENAAKGMAQQAIGGLFGGNVGGGFGSGGPFGGDSAPAGPDTVDDPISRSQKTVLTDPATGTKVAVGATLTDDGVLVSSEIIDAPGKGTFHGVIAQDDDCRLRYPVGRFLYELWLEWSLQIWWSKDTYVDGELVDHQEGEEFSAGSEMLGSGSGSATLFNEETRLGAPLWKSFGFGNPFSGAKSIGTLFNYDKQALSGDGRPMGIHITREQGDKVWTTPLTFKLRYDEFAGQGLKVTQISQEDLAPKPVQVQTDPVADLGQRPRLAVLWGDPFKFYGVTENPTQTEANKNAQAAYDAAGISTHATKLNAAAESAAATAVKGGQDPVEVGRVAGNALLHTTASKPKKGKPWAFTEDEALYGAAQQAQLAGGTPQQIGKAAGLLVFEDDLYEDEEIEIGPRRLFMMRWRPTIVGTQAMSDEQEAERLSRLDPIDALNKTYFVGRATRAVGLAVLDSGGTPQQAGAAIGTAAHAVTYGNPQTAEATGLMRMPPSTAGLTRPPPNTAGAVKDTIKILTAWYKSRGKTLSAADLGIAVGAAAEAAGANKKTVISEAVKAAQDAEATEAELFRVKTAVAAQ